MKAGSHQSGAAEQSDYEHQGCPSPVSVLADIEVADAGSLRVALKGVLAHDAPFAAYRVGYHSRRTGTRTERLRMPLTGCLIVPRAE